MFVYLIFSAAVLLDRQQSSAEINSDGFNIYKDYLRSKADEPYSFFDPNDAPSLYVLRSPSLVFGNTPNMEKRGVNQFKSLMLSPQRDAELGTGDMPDKPEDTIYHFPRVVIKRAAAEAAPICDWRELFATMSANSQKK